MNAHHVSLLRSLQDVRRYMQRPQNNAIERWTLVQLAVTMQTEMLKTTRRGAAPSKGWEQDSASLTLTFSIPPV